MSEEKSKLDQLNDAYQEAKKVLDAFVAKNSAVLDEFKKLVEYYNAAVDNLKSTVKAMATETGKVVMAGPSMAKPHTHPVWDLDKVAEILPDKTFRTAVRIDYKLKPAGVGEKILLGLEKEYPKLLDVKGMKVTRVDVSGPDTVSTAGLDAVGG